MGEKTIYTCDICGDDILDEKGYVFNYSFQEIESHKKGFSTSDKTVIVGKCCFHEYIDKISTQKKS